MPEEKARVVSTAARNVRIIILIIIIISIMVIHSTSASSADWATWDQLTSEITKDARPWCLLLV